MTNNATGPDAPDSLRSEARRRLGRAATETSEWSRADTQSLVAELELHQEELRIQNEELQQARNQLESALDRYRNLFEQAPVGYLLLDQAGRIREANHPAAELLGDDKGMIDQPLAAYVAAESQDTLYFLRRALVPDMAPRSDELTLAGEGDARRIVQVKTLADPTTGPDDPRFRCALVDITEHRELSSEMRKLALVARSTLNPVIITDVRGSIEWVNPSFETLTGYQFDDVIGRQPGEFLQGPETDQETRRRLANAIQQGQAVREEILNYDRFGNWYWLDLDIQPVHDESGELTNFVSVQTNITQLKALEASLRQARDDAEAMSQAKSSLIANVSHELRTPLNGIIGITELLRRDPGRHDLTEQLGILRESADGLLELINELLDLSKIEAGSMELESRPFKLSDLFQSLEHLFRPEAERKGLELVFSLDESVPPCLRGDSHRLRQILINLLNNAIKFTETGTVRLAAGASSMSGDAVQTVIRVSDTGPGIPESAQDQVFEPFSQADSSVVRQYGGTGLGLAICRQLAHLMEGSITLDSQVNKGTMFTLTLPLLTASQADVAALEADREQAPTPSVAAQGYRILLVEDNDINRHVATAMLEELGMRVVSCDSGAQGLKAFEACGFDLVLLDIQMPDMSGYDVAIRMRAIETERGQRTPILAVTAHSISVASLDVRSEGFDALVRKPLTFQGVEDALKDWLMDADEGASDGRGPSSQHNAIPSEPGPGEKSALIDEALVQKNLNGDARLVRTLTELFERQHCDYLDLIDTAVQSGDTASLAEAAHKLKGAVGYFNQAELWQNVADLEKVASEGANNDTARVEQVREQVLALAEEVRHLIPRDPAEGRKESDHGE